VPSMILCADSKYTLKATTTNGTGNITYQWQVSNDNVTFTDSLGATADSLVIPTQQARIRYYRLRAAANGVGCGSATSAVSEIEVVPNLEVEVNIPNITVCQNGDATLNATTVKGTGTISYQWQKSSDKLAWANIPGANGTSYTPNTSTPDTTYYKIVASASGYGCSADTSAISTVIVVPNLGASVNLSNIELCSGPDTLLIGKITNGTGNITLQWLRSTNLISWSPIAGESNDSLLLNTTTPGTTYYRLIATASGNGCGTDSSDYAIVRIRPNPVVTIAGGEFCTATDITLNGTGGGTYLWNGPSAFTSTDQNPVIANADSTLNDGKYYLEVTNSFGCKTKDSVLVDILPLPAPPNVLGAQICGPGTLSLSASNCNGNINWYDQQFSGNVLLTGTNFVTNNLSGSKNYFASCVSVKNCTSPYRSVVEARVNVAPVTEPLVSDPTCLGTSVLNNGMITLTRSKAGETFTVNSGNTYNGSIASAPILIPSNGIIRSDLAGPAKGVNDFYTIRITSAEGCPIDKVISIANSCSDCEPGYCPPAVINKSK
jgi:large repetitive protein